MMNIRFRPTPVSPLLIFAGLAALTLGSACISFDDTPSLAWWDEHPPIPAVDTSASPDGVVALPVAAHATLRKVFDKYTHLVAPSGRPIHFLAQPGVSNECLVRARELMRFFLTDASGTLYGSDKAEVANQMADRWATLVIFETYADSLRAQDGDLPMIPMFFQDLYADECTVEGSMAYLENSVRDATIEAVFRLVHGAGIRFAQPVYEQQIKATAYGAVREGIWKTNLDWVLEASSAHQYITNILEVYYGIWAHDPHQTGQAFGGEYAFISRAAMERGDPLGVDLLEMFLPATMDFVCTVAPEFEGVFTLIETPGLDYTLKSRYLTHVALSGSSNSGLRGNHFDNRLSGNAGDNWIDGGGGDDVVSFRGLRADYTVEVKQDGVSVVDSIAGRDGSDVLTEVECLHFRDGPLPIEGECQHDFQLALAQTASSHASTRPWGHLKRNLASHMNTVIEELLQCFDRNQDDELGVSETKLNIRKLVKLADIDRSGAASRDELRDALVLVFTGEVELTMDPQREVERFFERYDLDGDGRVVPSELPQAMREGFERVDKNGDGAISPTELLPAYQG